MQIGLFFGYASPEIGAPVTRGRSLALYLQKNPAYEVISFAPVRSLQQGLHDGVYRYTDRSDLAKGIRQARLDAAVVSTPPLDHARWSAKELKNQGIPYVFDVRDPAVTQILSPHMNAVGTFWKSLKSWLKEELVVRNAYASVAVSQHLREQIQRIHPKSARSMTVAANGADPSIFWPRTPQERSDIRIKHNLPSKEKIIVYSGTIGLEFELNQFITSCAQTIKEQGITLLIIAASDSGEGISTLQNTAAQAGICDRIIIRHNIPQSEVSELVAASDLGLTGVAHRYKYAIQIKLYEYLMSGIPLVAKGVVGGGLHSVFSNDDRSGWFFDSWNAMANNLSSSLSNASEYRETLLAEYPDIVNKYSREPANRVITDILLNAIDQNR